MKGQWDLKSPRPLGGLSLGSGSPSTLQCDLNRPPLSPSVFPSVKGVPGSKSPGEVPARWTFYGIVTVVQRTCSVVRDWGSNLSATYWLPWKQTSPCFPHLLKGQIVGPTSEGAVS